ncbi:MAG: SLC13 family permease, partial [Anaerolineae bacterium]|nr:SLC13 family permease [Anaerolineae bacterium]
SLLVRGTWEAIGLLQNEKRNFVVVGSPEAMARQVVEFSTDSAVAVTALLVMVGLMISGLVPTVIAALIAAVLMVLGGCLSMEQAYRAISWSSVILIAAMIPMSTALEVSGGANFLANGLVSTLGAIGPFAVMAGVFILTTGFSQVISNTATTVLMAPIVLEAALELDISPYALLMMVVVGASTAFLTPIASPPNTMVMAPGGYGFNDYLKVGLPLTIIFLVISLALVPLIWPI